MPSPIQIDCSDDGFERLRCRCGNWSRLSLDEVELTVGTIRISGSVPTLLCDGCGLRRIPPGTKVAMCAVAAEAERRGTSTVKVDVAKAAGATQRFNYCTGVQLKYSALDTKYIPGLARESGFLTPVFFNKDALTYFYYHPDYTVTFESDSYGTLRTIRADYISFGLNRSGKLVMWLGDLDQFPQPDLMILAAHNIESDHDIGSEFYEGQIEAEFTELSQEKRIIRAQGEFAAEVFDNHGGLKLLQMDAEAVQLMSALRRPLHFTEAEFGEVVEVMTKLFIERINVAALKEDLRSTLSAQEFDKSKKFGGLKTLELWLSRKLKAANASELTLPMFVLYDLRVAFKHLIPAEKQQETQADCLERLRLPANTSLDAVYNDIAAKLQTGFELMTSLAISSREA